MNDAVPEAPANGYSDADDQGLVGGGEPIGIGNEFTGVLVRKVWTKQGARLEIFVPRSGRRILLDAMQLEILTAQDPDKFSELFAIQMSAPTGDEA